MEPLKRIVIKDEHIIVDAKRLISISNESRKFMIEYMTSDSKDKLNDRAFQLDSTFDYVLGEYDNKIVLIPLLKEDE